MKRYIIGVVPLWDDERSSIWMLPAYLDLIREAGALPIILPLSADAEELTQLCDMCSGFLLTGGQDVDPAIYGECAVEACGLPSPVRDAMERYILDYSIEHDRPLLGICRGIQFINAALGGTLYQDLPSEYSAAPRANHQMTPPYDRAVHRVSITAASPLAAMTKGLDLGVNSYHHQAVKTLAPSLEPMAVSEDGLIEALYMPGRRFFQAYQWHPELNFRVEESSRRIAEAFVAACRWLYIRPMR